MAASAGWAEGDMTETTASYDASARRITPLARELAERIRSSGPIPVDEFMAACLGHPEHGYYRTRPAIGAAGDFITAPEISQVFGELVGLWTAVVWQQMGAPVPFQLVELGPGRGTMMADALRATRRVAGFHEAARVVMVEPSPVLSEVQRATLHGSGTAVQWVADVAEVKNGATIVLANEVLDALPVRQLVRCEDGWRLRAVCLDAEGNLAFGGMDTIWTGPLPAVANEAQVGAVVETRDVGELAGHVARIAQAGPVAALLIDYGHEATALGDSLQAVRGHKPEHPLTSPGEADLTALVDFEAAAATFAGAGLVVGSVVTQAEWLGALGIAERASRLMAANPMRASTIETGIARLMAPHGMGTRFKVLGVRSPRSMPLPGFPAR